MKHHCRDFIEFIIGPPHKCVLLGTADETFNIQLPNMHASTCPPACLAVCLRISQTCCTLWQLAAANVFCTKNIGKTETVYCVWAFSRKVHTIHTMYSQKTIPTPVIRKEYLPVLIEEVIRLNWIKLPAPGPRPYTPIWASYCFLAFSTNNVHVHNNSNHSVCNESSCLKNWFDWIESNVLPTNSLPRSSWN